MKQEVGDEAVQRAEAGLSPFSKRRHELAKDREPDREEKRQGREREGDERSRGDEDGREDETRVRRHRERAAGEAGSDPSAQTKMLFF